MQSPGGNRAITETKAQNVVSLQPARAHSKPKTGRTRYVRFFAERLCFVLDGLEADEVVGWLRLTKAYVGSDGLLVADDKHLAVVTKIGKRWPALRDKLLALGLGRVDGGRWIDDDQDRNLEIQRRLSGRGSKAAIARWGDRHGT
jgi:hypothetical protein